MSNAKSQSAITNCDFASIQVLLLILLIALVSCSCTCQKDDNKQVLNPVASYDIDIPETSDLSFGSSSDILYTVSDNTGKAYKITNKGKVLSALVYTGSDLEGVTMVDNQYVFVAEERLRRIVKLDLQGNQIGQKDISVETNEENQGLEGLAYASFNAHFYIINEINPGLLIETDKDLNQVQSYQLSFADDYSGICVDEINQELWIVSDLSATVNRCNMQGKLIESFRIPVINAEGIAVDILNNRLYVVSDAKAKLYVFNINSK